MSGTLILFSEYTWTIAAQGREGEALGGQEKEEQRGSNILPREEEEDPRQDFRVTEHRKKKDYCIVVAATTSSPLLLAARSPPQLLAAWLSSPLFLICFLVLKQHCNRGGIMFWLSLFFGSEMKLWALQLGRNNALHFRRFLSPSLF